MGVGEHSEIQPCTAEPHTDLAEEGRISEIEIVFPVPVLFFNKRNNV